MVENVHQDDTVFEYVIVFPFACRLCLNEASYITVATATAKPTFTMGALRMFQI